MVFNLIDKCVWLLRYVNTCIQLLVEKIKLLNKRSTVSKSAHVKQNIFLLLATKIVPRWQVVFLLLFYAFNRDKILMKESYYESSYKRSLNTLIKVCCFLE